MKEIAGMRSIFGACGNPFAESANNTTTTPKAATKPKKRYSKPAELAEFEREYNAHKYDDSIMPEYARIKTHFSDKTANNLTTCIICHLEYNGHFATRVNTTGIYDKKRGIYRRTNARLGMADISAVINGLPIQIEVKAGRDKPRPDQLQVQREYERAGGKYVFVHNFAEWVQIYREIIPTAGIQSVAAILESTSGILPVQT